MILSSPWYAPAVGMWKKCKSLAPDMCCSPFIAFQLSTVKSQLDYHILYYDIYHTIANIKNVTTRHVGISGHMTYGIVHRCRQKSLLKFMWGFGKKLTMLPCNTKTTSIISATNAHQNVVQTGIHLSAACLYATCAQWAECCVRAKPLVICYFMQQEHTPMSTRVFMCTDRARQICPSLPFCVDSIAETYVWICDSYFSFDGLRARYSGRGRACDQFEICSGLSN